MSNTGECQTKNQGDYDVRNVVAAAVVSFDSIAYAACCVMRAVCAVFLTYQHKRTGILIAVVAG